MDPFTQSNGGILFVCRVKHVIAIGSQKYFEVDKLNQNYKEFEYLVFWVSSKTKMDWRNAIIS